MKALGRRRSRGALPAAALGMLTLLSIGADASESSRPSAQLRVTNGQALAVGQAPWQVGVRWAKSITTTTTTSPDGRVTQSTRIVSEVCGGTLLDATRVVTAAHCVIDDDDRARRATAPEVAVNAGTSQEDAADTAAGLQRAAVAAIAIHPHYAPASGEQAADVAILTLAAPLDLTGPFVSPAALPRPTDRRPRVGASLAVSGFGDVADGVNGDGSLLGGNVQAVAADHPHCKQLGGPSRDALTLCARAAAPTFATTCNGDSGGPVTLSGTSTLVGVISRRAGRCGDGTMGFVNILAPEIRVFVDGAGAVPYAPRNIGGTPARLSGRMKRRQAIRCAAGRWRHATQFRFTFSWPGAPGRVRKTGRSRVYRVTGADVRRRLRCTVEVSSAGGTAVVAGSLARRIRP